MGKKEMQAQQGEQLWLHSATLSVTELPLYHPPLAGTLLITHFEDRKDPHIESLPRLVSELGSSSNQADLEGPAAGHNPGGLDSVPWGMGLGDAGGGSPWGSEDQRQMEGRLAL
jgi:hypothetical protein